MMEAGELLGMSERQFRRYRDRYEEDGLEGLVDRRLGKPSPKRVPAADGERMLELYREAYRGWNVKHFHEHLRARSRLPLGLHLGEDAAAHGGLGGARQAARGASAQARAQAVRGHDAAPGRLARGLACGRAAARSDRHDGRRDEHDLLGVSGRGGRHGLDLSRAARGVHRARSAVEPLHRSRQPLLLHAEGGRSGRQGPADPGRPGARSISGSSTSRPIRRRRAGAASACSARCRIG